MRRLFALLLAAGLLGALQGCHHCVHGVCDCVDHHGAPLELGPGHPVAPLPAAPGAPLPPPLGVNPIDTAPAPLPVAEKPKL